MRGRIVGIRQTTRDAAPRVPFEKIARSVLPKNYELSLVLCGDALSRRINRTYRKKEYAPNVLSFPLEKNAGEVLLNVRKAEREAKKFGVSSRTRAAYLFVHACCHLKGLKHGKKMDALERAAMRKLKIS